MEKKEFVLVIIFTFVVVMIWIASDIYHTHSNITISPKLKQTLEPVDPNFDTATLKRVASNSSNLSR